MGGIKQEAKEYISKAKAPLRLLDYTGLLLSVRAVARTQK